MLFQVIDNKQACYKIYCDNKLVDDYKLDALSHTWAPVEHMSTEDIQYAKIWCHGATVSEVCPDHLLARWKDVSARAAVFLKTFKKAKINLEDVCFYDSVPEKFLLNFYNIKNQITNHVFSTYKKPKNYSFLKDLSFFLKKIESRELNIDLKNIDFSNQKVREVVSKINKANKNIIYNPWKTVTGRLTTEKNSFPILTLNKELRGAIKPKNDLFVELDFNAAEIRALLALLGQEQPEEDIHNWINNNIFNGKLDREKTKKKVFSWLYNPKAKNKKLNEYLDRDQLYKKYFVDGHVHTPYNRKIPVDRDKAVNYLVQSTTSDMLLEAALRIDKLLKNKKSFVCFCIHDSITIDMAAEDKDLLKELTGLFSKTKLGTFKFNLSIGKDFGSMRKVL